MRKLRVFPGNAPEDRKSGGASFAKKRYPQRWLSRFPSFSHKKRTPLCYAE